MSNYHTFGAGCIEVEVDCHTGDVSVLSAQLVMDLGKSLNPALDVGQVEGAFVQGLGYVTTEQVLQSPETGRFVTQNMSSYMIPTVADVPRFGNANASSRLNKLWKMFDISGASTSPSCLTRRVAPPAPATPPREWESRRSY